MMNDEVRRKKSQEEAAELPSCTSLFILHPYTFPLMDNTESLDFVHAFVPGKSERTLLLLHGTGGSESDLLGIGQTLASRASMLSPRGKILENGMPRFFRRLAEGVFDEADLIYRTRELANFLEQAATRYDLDRTKIIGVGYSNGANIAGSLLLLQPGTLCGAVLFRPMVPLIPETLPDLSRLPVLLAAGSHDPIISAENTNRLAALLRECGADVTFDLENAGHNLTANTIEKARRWIRARFPEV
jgi:phospholipase/carboxylesterase